MKIFITVFINLLLIIPGFSQQGFKELSEYLEQNQKSLGNDFAVLIWKKEDTIVYKKEMGQFNSKTKVPVGNAGNWLTAALVMTWVDEGNISLDDPINNYEPIFESYYKKYITFRHSLAHLHGIKTETKSFNKFFEKKKFDNLQKEVAAYASREIQSNTGNDFRYSNIGIDIAGGAIEIVGKKRRFDLQMQQRLTKKLKMRKTSFSNLTGGAVDPAEGGQSSGDDYINFLVMLMSGGQFQGQQILSEESVNEMLKNQVKPEQIKLAPESAAGFQYALGAWTMENDSEGNAKVFTSPDFYGTWPILDLCRGYAYVYIPKERSDKDLTIIQKEIKAIIDKQFESECK